MLKFVRIFAASSDQGERQAGPCEVCGDLNGDVHARSPNARRVVTFRLNSLHAAVQRRCLWCTVLYRGLEYLGSVRFLSTPHSEDLVIVKYITPHRPLRLKVYRPGESAPLGEYEFYTPNGSTPANLAFGCTRERTVNAVSKEIIKLIRDWTEYCIRHHSRCTSAGNETLPSRVINVGDTSGHRPWLEETYGGKKGKYVALSHCWGQYQPLTTTRATLDRRKAEIEWSLLPKTFQDAIEITRDLGIDYIWIDSLCIVQDDDEDWAENAAKMGTIFEGSYVTISATSATDSTKGCFPAQAISTEKAIVSSTDVPGTLKTPVHIRPFRGSAAHAWLTTPLPSTDEQRHAPILSRGWCFQERLLASRVVHFARDEMVFECKTGCQCECGGADPLSLKAHYVPPVDSEDSVTEPKPTIQDIQSKLTAFTWGLDKQKWRVLVEHYSTRNFTNLRDMLPALSALARRYAKGSNDTYLAGLWKSQLPWDLLWYSNDDTRCFRPLERTLSEPAVSDDEPDRVYTAPTFSWASRIGPISWVSAYDSAKPTATIVDAKCVPKSHDKFGGVEDGYVRIRGPSLPYSAKLFDPPNSAPFTGLLRNCSNGSCHFDTREGADIARTSPLRLLCVLKDERNAMYRSVDVATALILRPSKARPGTWRRVGILAWCDATIFDEQREMEVTIV